jgi:hypothetical protein
MMVEDLVKPGFCIEDSVILSEAKNLRFFSRRIPNQ